VGSKKRKTGTTIREQFFKEFYRFPFFEAVSLLERFFPDKKPLGQTLKPSEEAVRFSSKPGLAFPASEISGLKHLSQEKPVEMEVAFMGMIGPSGVLPHWYTEQAVERAQKKDSTLKDFYDIFHHRFISMFYLAWKKNRLIANYLPGGKDRISSYFLSLSGLGTPGIVQTTALRDKTLLYYCSGILSKGTPSVDTIESTAGCLSGFSAHVEQFIEQTLVLNDKDKTKIGTANSQLGTSAICGSCVSENQAKFRVNFGPLGYTDFLSFLPGGKLLSPTFSIIRQMVGIEYEFDIRVSLKSAETPHCILGSKASAPLLGLSTWLKSSGRACEDDPYVTFQEENLRLG